MSTHDYTGPHGKSTNNENDKKIIILLSILLTICFMVGRYIFPYPATRTEIHEVYIGEFEKKCRDAGGSIVYTGAGFTIPIDQWHCSVPSKDITNQIK